MDIQRIVLFAGLAIVSYLMVLAWNEDYHQPQQQQVAQQTASSAQTGSADSLKLPEESGNVSDGEFATPEDDSQSVSSMDGARSGEVSDQLITVRTDVLELKIDPVGGNLVESSLLDYDKSLDSKASLKILTNSGNRTYVLESDWSRRYRQ